MMFSQTSQPCTFERDCEVVMIPLGDEVTIPAGTVGYITQALGGSFTVFVDGNLFRVAGIDADAIGKQPVMPPSLAEDATENDVESLLWEQMKTVYDPEIPVNIVDLGLVYRCEMRTDENGERVVDVDMTLTAPGCDHRPGQRGTHIRSTVEPQHDVGSRAARDRDVLGPVNPRK
jgi:probable FeS assembly SUF system protein SufT